MNCWLDRSRPLGRGSREVRPPEPPPVINRARRPPGRGQRHGPELFPGEEVLLVRRHRAVLRAYVVHLAERWSREGDRLVPRPHHAPRDRRRVGVAVQDPATGTWTPAAPARRDVRSASWRSTDLAWARETIKGQAEREPYAWRALEERMPWFVGEVPIMEQVRLEARRLGAVYGYNRCCIADYAARMPEIQPTAEQVRATMGGDFVPCPRCARRIASLLGAGRTDLARYALRSLVADRLYPGPLTFDGRESLPLPEPSPLSFATRTYEPQPAAWRALVDARARRVETAAIAMRLRSRGRRGHPFDPLPRAAEQQAILRHWIDRETRLIDSLRWLLTERRPPSAKKSPTPRGGRRPW